MMDEEKGNSLYSITGLYVIPFRVNNENAFGGFFYSSMNPFTKETGKFVDSQGISFPFDLKIDETNGTLSFRQIYHSVNFGYDVTLQKNERGLYVGSRKRGRGEEIFEQGVIASVLKVDWSSKEFFDIFSLVKSDEQSRGKILPYVQESKRTGNIFEGHDELSPRDNSGELWNADDIPF